MALDSWRIRLVEQDDNKDLAKVLRNVLLEMGVPKVGTAYADPELDAIYESYQSSHSDYWVVCYGKQIFGGAGIAPLVGGAESYCELQKMYFSPQARGRGLGKKMIKLCLQKAKHYGFMNCYLETMPNMLDAQKLYRKMGFQYIEKPLGNTGHYSCPVWMIKNLRNDN